MTTLKNLILLSTLIFSFAAVESKEKGACKEEVKKVCGEVEKGEGRIKDCISKNLSSFSQNCQQRIEKRMKRKEARKGCREEVSKLCPGMKPGDGKLRQCIEENKESLSSECKKLGKKMKKRRKNKKQSEEE